MIKREEAADILREKLQQGDVQFVFEKKDHTIREAVGTTNLDFVPQDLWPKDMNGEYKPKDESNIVYFDKGKLAWRECKVDNIITIDGEEVEW